MTLRVASLLAVVALGSGPSVLAQDAPQLSQVQADYLEHCGGCHGIEGVSAAAVVPTLRHRAGYFLCTQSGREYIARLPSIATSTLSDAAVAQLLNFVAFDVGDAAGLVSGPQQYSAAEIHLLRRKPLNEVALSTYRAGVIEDLIRHCGAPPELRDYRPSAAPALVSRK